MSNLSGWDVAVLVLAAYISMIALVRLMRQRRHEVMTHYQLQVAAEQQRRRIAELHEKRRQARQRQMRPQPPSNDAEEGAA